VNTEQSIGTGDVANEGELITCLIAFQTRNYDPSQPCAWLHPPSKPGSQRARGENSPAVRAGYRRNFIGFCNEFGPEATCGPYAALLR
jgi:hypothetical protein